MEEIKDDPVNQSQELNSEPLETRQVEGAAIAAETTDLPEGLWRRSRSQPQVVVDGNGAPVVVVPPVGSNGVKRANAIVEQVISGHNSHAALVDALQLTLAAMRDARDTWPNYEPNVRWATAWDKAREALALASAQDTESGVSPATREG